MERLQKVMARLGIASRRHAEELIQKGLVKVNGQTVTTPGIKVTDLDLIEIEGSDRIFEREKFVYILLNKPEGVISSVTDPRNRRTVTDLVCENIKDRVYPVGRLDYDTSGLLILTNDGDLTYRLTHPGFGVEKTYRVWIKKDISNGALKTLQEGVKLEDGVTSPAKIVREEAVMRGNSLPVVEITIHEGKNRQVRRMFAAVGFPVVSLQRIAFGPVKLDENMRPGEYRLLTPAEIAGLKKEVGL